MYTASTPAPRLQAPPRPSSAISIMGAPSRTAPVNTRGAKHRIQQERLSSPEFADYYKATAEYPGLDRQQERRLGLTLIAGRVPVGPMTRAAHEARQTLITSNLRLVVAIAAVYAGQGVPLMDIIGAGNEGLIRAVDKYIPGRARFGTHATWWICDACSRYVMNAGPLVHIPRNVVASRRKIHRVEAEALTEGRVLDVETTALRAALTPAQVRRALAAHEQVLSLDAAVETRDGDGETITLGDTLPDESLTPVEAHAVNASARDELYRKIATVLTPRERIVLGLRYGLGELHGATMAYLDIGRALDCNRETVRQVELAALAKLRVSYEADGNPHALRQALLFPTAV